MHPTRRGKVVTKVLLSVLGRMERLRAANSLLTRDSLVIPFHVMQFLEPGSRESLQSLNLQGRGGRERRMHSFLVFVSSTHVRNTLSRCLSCCAESFCSQ